MKAIGKVAQAELRREPSNSLPVELIIVNDSISGVPLQHDVPQTSLQKYHFLEEIPWLRKIEDRAFEPHQIGFLLVCKGISCLRKAGI